MVPINENPLQVVVPEESHQYSHHHLRQNEHIVHIISQQAVYPCHIREPLRQGKRAPRIQQDTAAPDKKVLESDMRLLALIGMKHPPVVNDAIDHPPHYRAGERGIKIEDLKKFNQQNSHQEVDKTCKLRRELGFQENPKGKTPFPLLRPPFRPIIHLAAIRTTKP